MKKNPRTIHAGFLVRLRRDVRGNTLAIAAAALIPMLAMTGSAIDAARLYAVKARLQQACDAGVLAGRKFMADSNSSTLDANATTMANNFFTNNFKTGWFQTTGISFTPTKSTDNQVNGVAQTTVPLAVMGIFGFGSVVLNATCQARYDVADTDVMFVLDTTGSMACAASDSDATCNSWVGANSGKTYTRADGSTGYYVGEKSGSKIAALRNAVLDFYDTVANNIDSTTHVRYGFVTYAATVNVGKVLYALNPNYLATSWNYQSRKPIADYTISSTLANTYTNTSSSTCNNKAVARSPSTALTYNSSSGTATDTTVAYTTTSGGTCKVYNNVYGPTWQYQQVTYNLSSYLGGSAVDDPSKVDATKSTWQGCVEERHSNAGATSFDINNLAPDMDPDTAPSSSDVATRWRPHWPEVIYYRGSDATATPTSNGDSSSYPSLGNASLQSAGYSACGKQALRLNVMTRSAVSNFVNASDFEPLGPTYHDAGMTWGLRLISPTGMFASDTAAWAGRNVPNRYIVFMTDGEMAPSTTIYGAHGVELYDQRVTGGDMSQQLAEHNARFVAECSAAKARNITVFVVGFGQTLNSQLTSCASPGQAYYASDDASLDTAFKSIATQVAMLRISK